MRRVVLAMPTYGSVIPEVHKSAMAAVMFAASHGVQWKGLAGTDRESWSASRSLAVDALRDVDDVDGIMWMDADMTVPAEAFARLAGYGKDLVTGVYFQRKPPFWPNVYQFNPERNGFERMIRWGEDMLVPIGGFGFGCCYTSLDLIRKLPKSPFKFAEFSEDLGFCRMATEAGIIPHMDTGIMARHHRGSKWADEETFKRYRDILVSASDEKENPDMFVKAVPA